MTMLLSERAKSANPEDTAALLYELAPNVWWQQYKPISNDPDEWLKCLRCFAQIESTFKRYMKAEAYLNAAFILLPKEWDWTMTSSGGPGPMVITSGNERYIVGADITLALIAAIAESYGL